MLLVAASGKRVMARAVQIERGLDLGRAHASVHNEAACIGAGTTAQHQVQYIGSFHISTSWRAYRIFT